MGEHSVKNKVAAAVDEDLVCNVIGRDVFSCMSTVSHAYRAGYRTRRTCVFLMVFLFHGHWGVGRRVLHVS